MLKGSKRVKSLGSMERHTSSVKIRDAQHWFHIRITRGAFKTTIAKGLPTHIKSEALGMKPIKW